MSKDMYDARERYVDNLMYENSQVDSLTEEQHEALRKLCQIRHELHVNKESLFLTESINHETYWDYIDSNFFDLLSEVNLPSIELNISSIDYPTDYDYAECFDMEYDEAYGLVMEMAEEVNRKIEEYLRNIDKKYGTQYCPTGRNRM